MPIKLPRKNTDAAPATPAAKPSAATPAANTETSLAMYEDFDLASFKEAKEESDKSRESRFMKITAGKNVIRMLPARAGVGQKYPWVILWRHEVPVPGLDWPVKFPCPRLHEKRHCRVCATSKQLLSAAASIRNTIDRKVQEDRAKALEPKRKLLANAFKRNEIANGPKLWEFGKMIEAQLIGIRDPDGLAGGVNFSHPVTGHDLIVMKTGEKLSTDYKVREMNTPSPVLDDASELREFLAQMPNLQAEIAPPSDEEIAERLQGKSNDRGGARNVASPARGSEQSFTADDLDK
jgi:hypothetical protein